MTGECAPIPRRLRIARRWQWAAAAATAPFIIACFVGWPLGHFWPSAVGFLGFLPCIWLFSIKCHRCGYPAFADFAADERLKLDQRFWTRFWGKDYEGLHLPLKAACAKCGASFV